MKLQHRKNSTISSVSWFENVTNTTWRHATLNCYTTRWSRILAVLLYNDLFIHSHSFNALTSQSRASYSPSPVRAQVRYNCHRRSWTLAKPRPSLTCAGDSAPLMSCLFANTQSTTSFNSSSSNMVINSVFDIPRRSESLLSTTLSMEERKKSNQQTSRQASQTTSHEWTVTKERMKR